MKKKKIEEGLIENFPIIRKNIHLSQVSLHTQAKGIIENQITKKMLYSFYKELKIMQTNLKEMWKICTFKESDLLKNKKQQINKILSSKRWEIKIEEASYLEDKITHLNKDYEKIIDYFYTYLGTFRGYELLVDNIFMIKKNDEKVENIPLINENAFFKKEKIIIN